MLYKDPRGIGCNKCHGNKGEGSVIAKYKHNGKEKTLKAPRINNIEYDKFLKAFKSKKRRYMPKYFLTKQEIQSIYFYLSIQK